MVFPIHKKFTTAYALAFVAKFSTSNFDLLRLVKKDLQMMFSNLQMNCGHCIKFAVVEPSLWIHLLFLFSLTVLF
jgi:hypothetical protein